MIYDAIIIGAGLSGLAAGIRLALSGKKTLIVEQHSLAGGLNSYYRRDGRVIDVGLHAMTNFAARGTHGAPLTKLLRQLRLRYEDLDLIEQKFSAIAFPDKRLEFTNCFADFREAVARSFPRQAAGFDALAAAIENYDDVALTPAAVSAEQKLTEFIDDKNLREMLICPLMYYGNAAENDMDWTQFATMWKAIFRDGFCRPRGGMQPLIERLTAQYKKFGGEIRLGSRVEKIVVTGDGIAEKIRLARDEEIFAAQVFSSAGLRETENLCAQKILPPAAGAAATGKLGFAELILYFDRAPRDDGAAIIFFSRGENFRFAEARELIDENSGVICAPHNFAFADTDKIEPLLRVTALANFDRWNALNREQYAAAKKNAAAKMLALAENFYPSIRERKIVFQDLFTPKTVARFTGHFRGAIYGSPQKIRDGKTAFANLFLIGTDQGFLGIVGALLSGITIANLYGVKG